MKLAHFPVKIRLIRGVSGVTFFCLESSFFCYLGAHAKILNPTTIPAGVKASRLTLRGKVPKIVATCLCASSQGQGMHQHFVDRAPGIIL